MTGEQRAEALSQASQLLTRSFGGVTGLRQAFETQGLEQLLKDWMENGPRQAIKPRQLYPIMGHELLVEIAKRCDLSQAQTLAGLTQALPSYLHQLSASGAVTNPVTTH